MVCAAFGIKLSGINNSEITKLIESQISSWNDSYEDTAVVRAKLEKDGSIIKTVLNSFGYIDADVSSKLINGKAAFNVKLNTVYKLNDASIVYVDNKSCESGLGAAQILGVIGIDCDSYVDFRRITDGRDKLKEYFKTRGFAFVEILPPELEIDKRAKTAKAVYAVNLNGKTIIDSTTIRIKSQKNPKLLEPVVRNRIQWEDGAVYNPRKIEITTERLMESGIFSSIDVELSPPIADQNDPRICHTNALVNIEEAKLRDISAGVKYGSSEKIGVLLAWSHYNIDGRGSKLSTMADIAKKNRTLNVKYDMYDLFYKKQNLANKIFYMRDDVDAYTVSMIGAEVMLWQTFFNNFKAGVGVCHEHARTIDRVATEDDKKKVKFNAIGAPIGVNFDTTDNYLDPSNGVRCSLIVTPYFGKPSNISIVLAKAAMYLPIICSISKNTLVLSAYSKIGTVFRNKKHTVPRNKFFFAGGNNSVRGYGYQKISDLTDNGKPVGGESLFEFGIEPRVRITEDIGVVIFWEGGNVRKSGAILKFKDMLFGYGAGARYYTALGQIRFDVAFPTKVRKSKTGKRVDSRFNVYISVGQAF
jgi:translocation and assembly module TamA